MVRNLTYQLLFIVLFTRSIFAQVELYVHQPNCARKTIINIANNPQYEPKQINEETQLFTVDTPDEPMELVFIIDSIGLLIEKFWIDPTSKRIDFYLYNCRQYRFYVENPNYLTREARADSYYIKYLLEKTESREEYLKLYNQHKISYIKNNPNSFLSLDALWKLNISIDEKKELFKLIGDENKKYSLYNKIFKSINAEINLDSLKLDLKFCNIDKDTLHFNSFENKPVVLTFWMSGCKWSTKILPELISLDKNNEDVPFVYYCLDENLEQWRNSSKKFDIPEKYNISELNGFLSDLPILLGVDRTPYFVIADINQKIILVTFGDELYLIENEIKNFR